MSKRVGLTARNTSIRAAMTAAQEKPKAGKKSAPDATAAAPDDKKLIGLSVRLDADRHEQLRRISFEQRCSIHSLLLAAVDQVIAQHSKR